MNLTTDPDRPLSWFRFEAEFATSPRIGTLPEYTQLVLVWAMCATARRVVPCSDADFAWWTRSDLARIEEAKRLLLDSGLITDEWVPTDWHRCQPPTDRTNAERQRRHRERQKEVTNVPADNPEDRNAVTNALLTPAQDRTGQDRQDITDRTGQDTVTAANRHTAQPLSSGLPPVLKSIVPLQDPFPRTVNAGKRKTDDFEAINDRIAKLVNEAGIPASDTDALAKLAGVTEKQARVAVNQLRDRRRLA